MLPDRKTLPHDIPHWVKTGSPYFITISCKARGKNQLCNNEVLELARESLNFRQNRQELWVHLFLLMPDHLHAIMSFGADVSMRTCIAQWKRYITSKSTVAWQRDFFDHRLRNDDSYVEKAQYIRMNPVRAGWVKNPEEWKYVIEGR